MTNPFDWKKTDDIYEMSYLKKNAKTKNKRRKKNKKEKKNKRRKKKKNK